MPRGNIPSNPGRACRGLPPCLAIPEDDGRAAGRPRGSAKPGVIWPSAGRQSAIYGEDRDPWNLGRASPTYGTIRTDVTTSLCDDDHVTLVLSVHSRDSLWLVVDRRLSYGGRRPPIDDAVKVMNLETTDGVGLLAYAGLGATSQGTQPSEWMSAVLRGRGGLTFEQALGVLSAAANKQLPKHLVRMPGGAHFIVVPAFVRGVGSRLYSIDNVLDPRRRSIGIAVRVINARPCRGHRASDSPSGGLAASTSLRKAGRGSGSGNC